MACTGPTESQGKGGRPLENSSKHLSGTWSSSGHDIASVDPIPAWNRSRNTAKHYHPQISRHYPRPFESLEGKVNTGLSMKYCHRLAVWHMFLRIVHNGDNKKSTFIPYFEFTTKIHTLNSNHIPKTIVIMTTPIPNGTIFENADNIDDSLARVVNADCHGSRWSSRRRRICCRLTKSNTCIQSLGNRLISI